MQAPLNRPSLLCTPSSAKLKNVTTITIIYARIKNGVECRLDRSVCWMWRTQTEVDRKIPHVLKICYL